MISANKPSSKPWKLALSALLFCGGFAGGWLIIRAMQPANFVPQVIVADNPPEKSDNRSQPPDSAANTEQTSEDRSPPIINVDVPAPTLNPLFAAGMLALVKPQIVATVDKMCKGVNISADERQLILDEFISSTEKMLSGAMLSEKFDPQNMKMPNIQKLLNRKLRAELPAERATQIISALEHNMYGSEGMAEGVDKLLSENLALTAEQSATVKQAVKSAAKGLFEPNFEELPDELDLTTIQELLKKDRSQFSERLAAKLKGILTPDQFEAFERDKWRYTQRFGPADTSGQLAMLEERMPMSGAEKEKLAELNALELYDEDKIEAVVGKERAAEIKEALKDGQELKWADERKIAVASIAKTHHLTGEEENKVLGAIAAAEIRSAAEEGEHMSSLSSRISEGENLNEADMAAFLLRPQEILLEELSKFLPKEKISALSADPLALQRLSMFVQVSSGAKHRGP